MDFLLILIAIGGFVVSIVMLVLASRVTREQKASDARVATLQSMATGSVLFAPAMADESDVEASSNDDLELALFELPDEDDVNAATPTGVAIAREEPAVGTPEDYAMPAPGYPFVMTVLAAAGTGRGQVSFDRTQRRSRP